MLENRTSVPALKDLDLPPVVGDLCTLPRGLVIVAGDAGQGKSASIAAMGGHRNESSGGHVVIDPIPDRQAMERAIELSRAHLCIAALEASSVFSALECIVGFFPDDGRRQILAELGLTIAAVIAQELVPTKDGMGRVPATGILVATRQVQQLFYEDRLDALYGMNGIMASSHLGMHTFDQHLVDLYERGRISYETALRHGHSVSEVALMIKNNRRSRAFSPLWKDFVFELVGEQRWPSGSGPSPFDPGAALQRFLDEGGESASLPLEMARNVDGDDAVAVSLRRWASFGLERLGVRTAATALEIRIPGLSLADGSLVDYLTGGPPTEKITERHLDAAIVISVSGRANMGGDVYERMTRLIPHAREHVKALVFDFSHWQYCDSGWAALAVAAKAGKADGMPVVAVTPQQRAMRERFEMSRWHLAIRCYPSVETALAALASDTR